MVFSPGRAECTGNANTFILAWSDDGQAALLARRERNAYSLELVSAEREHMQQFTIGAKDDCQARMKRLAASLKALSFHGVEARGRACGGPADTVIRTLKRHAEQAQDSFIAGEAPAVPEPPEGAVRYATVGKLILAFAAKDGGAVLARAYIREGDSYQRIR